jgi:hypothetical protein
MSQRHSAAFDRAVRIELLRTKAAMQRQSIAIHARGLGHDADPRRQLTHWLSSGKAGPLGQGLGLMSRYPFLLSTFSTAFANRRWGRALSVAATIGAVWWFATRASGEDRRR